MNASLFGLEHILILFVCLIYIVASLMLLNKHKVKLSTVYRMMLIIGIVSETIKVMTYIVANEAKYFGYLPKTDLPFHLCSIQIIFIIILNISNNEKIRRTLPAFMLPTCLIGGFAAMMLPTSSSLNMWMITVQYFLYHASIVLFAIYLYVSNEIHFTFKDYTTSLTCLFAMAFIAIYLNSWIYDGNASTVGNKNINFMYVLSPPMNGLPYLNKDHGWLVYFVHYALLCVFGISLCYIKPIIEKVKAVVIKTS